jgi:branched-chain amino acid transport system permease protein
MVFLWRDSQLSFPRLLPIVHFRVGCLEVNSLQLFIIGASVVLMAVLSVFVKKTKLGKAMRAVSQDGETAELMGIPVNSIIALTFFIGAALGGAAGVLNGMYYGSIKYNMGFLPGIKAFTAAVLGGIGHIPGAMLGGFLLGLLEALGAGFLPEAEWKDVFAFAILIVVLIFRPSGLLGENVSEKV